MKSINCAVYCCVALSLLSGSALAQDESTQNLCLEFKQVFGIQEQRILIQLIYQVALADGSVQDAEQLLIDEIVRMLYELKEQQQG